jgi:polyhydroxybutyrate depolymerase
MRPLLRALLAAILLSLPAGVPFAQGAGGGPGDRIITLTHQGRTRQYLLHVPGVSIGARALVLAFHGGGQSPDQMRQISGFNVIADRERFIVVYPEAFEKSWADGRHETQAEREGVDDVDFAKAVVADIARLFALDSSRIFATGLSNGGILAHRLGCEAADTFVAIAPVAASMATAIANTCRPVAPVAVIAIQGRDDPAVRFEGGPVGNQPGSPVLASRAAEMLWRALNACAPKVIASPLGVFIKDGTKVERRIYTNCRGNAEVVWYEIHGGGHRWPPHQEGTSEATVRKENGVSSQNLNASEIIWKFFERHQRLSQAPVR